MSETGERNGRISCRVSILQNGTFTALNVMMMKHFRCSQAVYTYSGGDIELRLSAAMGPNKERPTETRMHLFFRFLESVRELL